MKKSSLLAVGTLAAVLFAFGQAQAADAAKPTKPTKETEQQVYADSDIKVKVSTGFDYSSGKYGQADKTEIWYVPVSAKVEKGNWTAKITVPWLSIKGPSSVLGGGGDGIITGGSSTTVKTESGLGDIVTALAYDIELPATTYLDLTGKVKIPTGDYDKGLGTGEADYSVLFDLTKMIGHLSLFGGAGYKFVGTNSTLHLRDSVLVNGGFGYDILTNLNAGMTYDWRLSPSRTADPSEATLYFNYKITPKINVQVYGNKGFSDASAAYGYGLMAGYKF